MVPILIFAAVFHLVVSGDDWGYRSHNGPTTWGGKCQEGFRQSPIDIRASDVDYALLHRIHFKHYSHTGTVNVTNNGHSVVVDGFSSWAAKQPVIHGGGLLHEYKLIQFHLHWAQHDHTGSEHKLAGLHYPAELHLVHLRSDLSIAEALKKPNGLAVVGVFLAVSQDSSPLSDLSTVLDSVAGYRNKTNVEGFRALPLLPSKTDAFYRYDGSLTTPGCQESVIWTLLAEPASISKDQLKQLRNLQENDGIPFSHNYRPVQPLNGRRIQYRPSKFDRKLLQETMSSSISAYFILPTFITLLHLLQL